MFLGEDFCVLLLRLQTWEHGVDNKKRNQDVDGEKERTMFLVRLLGWLLWRFWLFEVRLFLSCGCFLYSSLR